MFVLQKVKSGRLVQELNYKSLIDGIAFMKYLQHDAVRQALKNNQNFELFHSDIYNSCGITINHCTTTWIIVYRKNKHDHMHDVRIENINSLIINNLMK